MRTWRSLKSPCSACAWQALQLEGLFTVGRFHAAGGTSSCLRVNQADRVMRSSGGASWTRLLVPAFAASQVDSSFTEVASSEASAPKWRGRPVIRRCQDEAGSIPGG
jgi:hypothetical protein